MLIDFLESRLNRRRRGTIVESIVIDVAAIFLWRGLWGLMDLYIFPQQQELSLWVSLALGIGGLGLWRYWNR